MRLLRPHCRRQPLALLLDAVPYDALHEHVEDHVIEPVAGEVADVVVANDVRVEAKEVGVGWGAGEGTAQAEETDERGGGERVYGLQGSYLDCGARGARTVATSLPGCRPRALLRAA